MSAKELCLHVSASQGKLQWNPVNTVTNGPNTFGRVNRVAILTRVFLQKSVWWFLSGCQKK